MAAILGGLVQVTIRKVQTMGKVHFLVLPLSYGMSNMILNPVFLIVKSFVVPETPASYNLEEIIAIILASFFIFKK